MLGALGVAGLALAVQAQSTSTMEQMMHSVGTVVVSGSASRGSAVTVAPKVMVTHRSVIAGGDRLQVYLAGQILDASLRNCDSHGLCLLDVPRLDAEPVEFGETGDLQVGDKVLLAASSDDPSVRKLSGAVSVSQGMVTARRTQGEAMVLDHAAPSSAAASGGGVFDPNGRFLGVNWVDGGARQSVLPALWVRAMGVFGAAGAGLGSTHGNSKNVNNLEVSPQLELVHDQTRQSLPPVALETPAHLPAFQIMKPWLIGGGVALLILIGLLRLFQRPEPEPAHRQPMAHDPMPAAMARASDELGRGQVDGALWDLVKQAARGDADKARHLYLQRRARDILSSEAKHRMHRSR